VSLPVDIIAFCIVASILRVRANWSNGANNFPNDTQDIDIWPIGRECEGEVCRRRVGSGSRGEGRGKCIENTKIISLPLGDAI